MVKIKGKDDKKVEVYYTKACKILEDLVEKENNPSLKFYSVTGTVYNDYPDCVSGVVEMEITKKFLRKPSIHLDVYDKDFFNIAYKTAEWIEKELKIKVTLEKAYME